MTSDDAGFDPNGSNGSKISKSPRRRVDWTWAEVQALRQHPDMTAGELHELIPRHSENAIRCQRKRMGRYHTDATPLCQRCGEHPVWEEAADARRWGLCKACALEEREYRLRHGVDLVRKDNAIRQAAFKSRHRKKGGK